MEYLNNEFSLEIFLRAIYVMEINSHHKWVTLNQTHTWNPHRGDRKLTSPFECRCNGRFLSNPTIITSLTEYNRLLFQIKLREIKIVWKIFFDEA